MRGCSPSLTRRVPVLCDHNDSMALRRSVAAALGLALVASPFSMHGARAEEVEVEVEESPTHFLTDMPLEADGVETTFLFPENRDHALTSGETVELLCGFYNGGDVPLNVTMVGGSLNSPLDFRLYVQNWTSPMFNTVVQPDMQATFGITIKPASQLQAHEYTAAMSIFYESDTELFASTFFNSTVLIQEPGRFLDLQTFFMYVFIVAVVGGLAFSGFKGLQSAGVLKKKSSKARSAVGARTVVGEDNEWLKGTAADSLTAPKKRSVRRK